jgi:hypothetical protein
VYTLVRTLHPLDFRFVYCRIIVLCLFVVLMARTYVVCGQSVGDVAGVGATECNAYVSLRSRPSWFGR